MRLPVAALALLLWGAPAAGQEWFPPDSSLMSILRRMVHDRRAVGVVVGSCRPMVAAESWVSERTQPL